ncbi:MAG: RnfH family protein [Sulfuricaulis sp.]|uniref:RnfH family protein n=1 Tax=Sulfuricaulis sp. TaxID=2003553 RepID=UPI003C538536
MSAEQTWRVEIVYATPVRQEIIEVSVRPGATVEEVIRTSGMLAKFPEIDLTRQRVGIFGVIARLQDAVHDGDRVEIYRPLVADPKEARRKRAARGGKKL